MAIGGMKKMRDVDKFELLCLVYWMGVAILFALRFAER